MDLPDTPPGPPGADVPTQPHPLPRPADDPILLPDADPPPPQPPQQPRPSSVRE